MSTTTATVATTDLDRLAERVERAATVIVELRAKNAQLEAERVQLRRQLDETTSRLQGQDPTTILNELSQLKREQREWQAERRDVATRIEAIAAKLEKIEA